MELITIISYIHLKKGFVWIKEIVFLTSFLQFEVKPPLEQIWIYLILRNNVFSLFKWKEWFFTSYLFDLREYFFDSNAVLAKTSEIIYIILWSLNEYNFCFKLKKIFLWVTLRMFNSKEKKTIKKFH